MNDGSGSDPTPDPADEGGRGRLEQAVDLCILAPIGLLADAGAVVPELVQRGRGQVANARAVGRFTVEKAGVTVRDAQRAGLDALRRLATQPDGTPAQEEASEGAAPEPGSQPPEHSSEPDESVPVTAGVAAPGSPSPEGLAIPDYDSLSASQVVPRLESLSPEELEAVRLYEIGSRGRKTILGRISQLQRPAG